MPFPCLHVCTWLMYVCEKNEGAKQRKGVLMFVCVCVGGFRGVLCVEVDKALCVSMHAPVMCVYSPRLTHSSHTSLI